jgi:hypothetical protein
VQVSGLDPDLDLRRILSAVKKLFSCNGSIQTTAECVFVARPPPPRFPSRFLESGSYVCVCAGMAR